MTHFFFLLKDGLYLHEGGTHKIDLDLSLNGHRPNLGYYSLCHEFRKEVPTPCMRQLPKDSAKFKTKSITGGEPSKARGNNMHIVNFWFCQLWEYVILSILKACLEQEFICFEILLHIVRIYQYVLCCTDLNLHNYNYN